MDRIERLEKKVEQLESALSEAKAAAERADDYRQVANAMMRHIYGYYYHMEKEELEKYWVSSRDDLMYAHGDMTHLGRDGVYKYYVLGTDRTKAEARALANRFYGVEYKDNEAAGYRVVHILGSPFIEIAADRSFAQGVWTAFSTMARIEEDGLARPFSQVQRFSGEFLNEDGAWKLWHVRDYEDFTFDTYKIARELDGGARPSDPKRAYGPTDPEIKREMGIRELEFFSSCGYQPWTATAVEPRLPDPFETMADAVPFNRLMD